MEPDNYIFTYTMKNIPIFWNVPSCYETKHLQHRLSKLIRVYFKLIRTKTLSYTFLIPGDCGAITCGELAMYIIRREQIIRKNIKRKKH